MGIDQVAMVKVLETGEYSIDPVGERFEASGYYPELDASDWFVTIGDTGRHIANMSVIDSDTCEFLFSIPIA